MHTHIEVALRAMPTWNQSDDIKFQFLVHELPRLKPTDAETRQTKVNIRLMVTRCLWMAYVIFFLVTQLQETAVNMFKGSDNKIQNEDNNNFPTREVGLNAVCNVMQ